jgi:two-component system OmpR family sensor kinase/two-component system sensor histidine kinase BaeS
VNEPWPPRGGPQAWRRHRGRFRRRVGLLFALALLLMAIGLTTVVSWMLPGANVPLFVRPQRVFFALLWIFILLALFRRLMGRFGTPLGEIVEAADRVAEGDYSVRTTEYGPRWMRTLARAFNSMTSKLQAQDLQRRHLMADIAHELRTPLAVLEGRLEGMLDGVYPRDEAQIAAVLQETRMLTRLVDDLRTLAHTESGTLALQKEVTDLGILINDAAAAFSAEAHERRIAVTVTAPADLALVNVDPLRIREVLVNLISNAMRHTPEGGRVSVAAASQAASIAVTVSDTGAGINAEEVPKIFDRFYKGRASRGSGLGLTIARNLVVAHGGEIRAASVEGKGTEVRFTLPVG